MNQYFFNTEYYITFYYLLVSLTVILTIIFFLNNNWEKVSRENFSISFGYVFLFIIIFYLSFRPIYIKTGDAESYLNYYYKYKSQSFFDWESKEKIFFGMTWILSKLMIPEFYFAILGSIYILTIYFACKKWLKKEWFFILIFFVISFQFLNYGINGIRQGLATSIFLLAISRKQIFWQIVLFYLAFGMHKTIVLPIFAFLSTLIVNNPKLFISYWFLCIPLSLTNGAFFEETLSSYYEEDADYFQDHYDDQFSQVGFRWDFIIYSFVPILLGIYYIFIKKFNDYYYKRILNTYIVANGFWILVIGISFSNRMAYLSWFMIAFLLIYPIFKSDNMKPNLKNNIYISILFLYFVLTIILNRNFLF
jgi:hypothetical protein